MKLMRYLHRAKTAFNNAADLSISQEASNLLNGRILAELISTKKHISSLSEVEFKVFSQWGDDGIIQWLIHNLNIPEQTFIEFGVSNYRESNTRFLMMNNNWSGLVIDGSSENVRHILHSEYYWKYELAAKTAFIDCDNINGLISAAGFHEDLGILHIDLDGNDYWIWQAIHVVRPVVVILEYNSVFGSDRAITVPYDKYFNRTVKHYSNLYFGASLKALIQVSSTKDYAFIGCNSAGNNAYFVRRDKLSPEVRETTLQEGYVLSKAREARSRTGSLSITTGSSRLESIRGLPVYNVETSAIEAL